MDDELFMGTTTVQESANDVDIVSEETKSPAMRQKSVIDMLIPLKIEDLY